MSDDLWQERSNTILTQPYLIQSDQGPLHGQSTVVGLSVSCHTQENVSSISEFYIIEQVFNINPSQMYQLNDRVKGYFIADITIETISPNFEDQPDMLPLLSSSPSTTVGSTSYTTSTSYTFGGSIGVMGDQLTASVSESYTVSNSTTVNIPDISIENNSLTLGNNAVWKFSFNNNDMEYADGSNATTSSITNFQPTVNAMWELKIADNPLIGPPTFQTRITMNFRRTGYPLMQPLSSTITMNENYNFTVMKPVPPPAPVK
ncbi:hypothetical protein [Paenibacillus monticola]|uniref:Uncharacterized protein n=1 Tax=Paenibacillus monticola TaxID=2666075 RepID=A0A7X2H7N9_9BACL|nr:hypothetical protein [Paenibacillus monticola]MRN55046.1 hypothetical protein [Paenibacillus monticola]